MNELQKRVAKWTNANFGAPAATHPEHSEFKERRFDFLPDSPLFQAWKDLAETDTDCSATAFITASSATVSSRGTGVVDLSFLPIVFSKKHLQEQCITLMLAYLATQPEVFSIEPIVSLITVGSIRDGPATSPIDSLDDEGNAEPLNDRGSTALQSGSSAQPYPFWGIGINGSGQFVQVTDTGADDASCFLRDFDVAASLTGVFNSNAQVARS
jgi:hypothetical protein